MLKRAMDFTNYLKAITSERINIVRTYLGLTQIEFAKALGVSHTNIYYYENQKRTVSVEFLYALHRVYGINPLFILGFSDKMELSEMITDDGN